LRAASLIQELNRYKEMNKENQYIDISTLHKNLSLDSEELANNNNNNNIDKPNSDQWIPW
jgi:hypothetical protein